jgi:hypothetical protein
MTVTVGCGNFYLISYAFDSAETDKSSEHNDVRCTPSDLLSCELLGSTEVGLSSSGDFRVLSLRMQPHHDQLILPPFPH